MCTQDEVRQVIRETAAPLWMRRVMGVVGALSVLFIGWLAYETHMQDEARVKQDASIAAQLNKAEVARAKANALLGAKIDNIRFIYTSAIAEVDSRVERIALEIEHVKELALSRSTDRYTGRDAKSRNDLMDERCKTVDRRLKEIEDAMEKLHKINL